MMRANSNPVRAGRSLRGWLLASAALSIPLLPAAAQTTTNVPSGTTRTTVVTTGANNIVNVDGTLTVAGTPRAINYNANGTNNGPVITNTGTIEDTAAGTSYAIGSNGDFANRSITINNNGGTIRAGSFGIQITNTANAATGSIITINNSGLISATAGRAIDVSGMSGAALNLTNTANGTITGQGGVFNDSTATIVNNGTIRGTGGGSGVLANGEALRLTGNGNYTVTLGASSITQNTSGTTPGNAIFLFGTGINTINIAAGASVGRIQASAAGTSDTLNLNGPGNGTLAATAAFETLNVNGGAWTLTGASSFAGTATVFAGASMDAGTTGGLAAGTIDNRGTITSALNPAVTNVASTALTFANSGTITAGQGVVADSGGTFTNNGSITGTSGTGEAFRLSGTANYTVNLSASSVTQNTSTTPTAPNALTFTGTGANVLNVAAGASVGRLKGSATGTNDTLNLNGPGNGALGATVDFEALNVNGGTWSFSAASIINGTATIASGAAVRFIDNLTAGTGGSLTANVVNNGSIEFARTLSGTQAGGIGGTGTVSLTGSATIELGGASSYSGATRISAGRLQVGADNVLSANSAITVDANGTLSLNDSATDASGVTTPVAHSQTIANLSGAGSVRLGQLNAATLTTGGGGGNTTFSGVLSQLGNLTKIGSGTLTLSGANTATGVLTAAGGTIALTGSWTGGGAVANGATLAGGGTLTGTLTVADSGIVAPGNGGIGTLTVGGLSLSSGSILAYDIGAAPSSDRIAVNGSLILDGTLNIANAGGFGQGVYRLIDYTGTLTDNGLVVGTVPAGADAGQMQIQTAVTSQVNLVYGVSAPAAIQFWDGVNTTDNGAIDGGSGSWNLATPNWTGADGTGNTAWGGNFGVFQGAAGTVSVDAAIGFTGAQFTTDGYIIVGGTGSLSATAAQTNLRVDPNVTATIAAPIGGSGGVIKNDSGTLILAGANGYAGVTIVAGGILRAATTGALPGPTALTIQNGGTLDLAASQTVGSLAGAGTLTLGGGSLTSGGLNTSTTFAGAISGAGGLTKVGIGTLTLSGPATYSGATSVAAGTLLQGAVGAFGPGALDIAPGATANLNAFPTSVASLSGGGRLLLGANGALTTSGNADTTFSGTIAGGNATLFKGGTGTLTLAGTTNTFAGTVDITAGRVALTNAGALGDGASVTVRAGATLTLGSDKTIAALRGNGGVSLGGNRLTIATAQNSTYSGNAAGTGGLTKTGSSTLILAGTNSYTGDTVVSAGTLGVTGSVAANATVSGGATLVGTGSIGGTVTVSDGTLAPGVDGVGTLTAAGLILTAASTLAYDLGAPNALGTSDRIQVNGNLTLDGTLNVTDAGGFGQGVYRLIDYTGTLTDNGLVVGTLPGTFSPSRSQVQTAVAGQVNLIVANTLPAIQFWDGSQTVTNGRIDGGSGRWNNSLTNWTDASGSGNDVWGGNFAVFQGAAGTVSVTEAVATTGLQFMTDGYVIAAGGGAVTIANATTAIRVDPGVTATIAAPIVGAGGIAKLDAGTLVLTGANTFGGNTQIIGGTLRAGGARALPIGTAVTIADGAVLDLTAAQTIGSLAGSGTVTLSGAGLTTGGNDASTQYGGVISGSGPLTKTGAGTFTLAGANTYTGGTTVAAGTLSLNGGRIGGGNLAVASGATLDLNGVTSTVADLSGGGTIALGTATLNAGGAGSTTFSGAITGSGSFTKIGGGTLSVTGTSSYTGATRVAAGTLTLASSGALPTSAVVTIDSGATLGLEVSRTIASLNGAGAVDLGANTLTVSAGTYTGAVRGSGGLTKTGSATLTFGGVQAYTGATTIAGGTLTVSASGSLASSSGIALTASGAILDLSATTDQSISMLSGVSGTIVRLGSGTLTTNVAGTATYSGTIAGSGGLAKAGAGTLTLAAADSYTGATTVVAGTLRAGALRAIGTGAASVASGAVLDLNGFNHTLASVAGAGTVALGSATLTVGDASTTTFGGSISGTGGLTKVGSGTLILSGASSYTGATAVNAGQLTVNGSLASTVTVGANGRLGGSGTTGGLVVNGTIAPGNSIGTLTVAGALTLGASSTYAVEVNPAGQSDRIMASGVATLSGGAVSVLGGASSGYLPLTTYTILTATGGLTGQFGSVSSDLAFLTPTLVYGGNSVTLRLQRNDVALTSVATTDNQRAVAASLQASASGTLFDAVVNLSAVAAQAAFDSLSGEVHADALTFANRAAQDVQRPLLDRIAAADGDDGVQLWLQGRLGRSDVDSGNGYSALDGRRVGAIGGADFTRGAARVGLAVGYDDADLDVDARASSASVRSLNVTAYGGFAVGKLRARIAGGYVHHRIGTDRTIAAGSVSGTSTASYTADTLQAFGEVGYRFGSKRVGIEPFAGIALSRTRTDRAMETGTAAALQLDGDTASSTLATLGVRLSARLDGGIRLDGAIAARRYLTDADGSRTAFFAGSTQSFRIGGSDFGRDGGLVRLGVSIPALSGRLGLAGDGDFAGRNTSYGGRVTAAWRF